MAATRWRKIVRDLAGHWFRTLLVVLSIAVGIFAVSVVMGSRGVLIREFDAEYDASNPLNASFRTAPFDEPLVRRAGQAAGVEHAQGRHVADLRYTWSGSKHEETIQLVAVRDYEQIDVERITPEEQATWPPERGQVLLERSARQTGDYEIGDVLEVQTRTGETAELVVAGFAHDINAVPARFTGSATGFISFDSLSLLDESEHYNELIVSMSADELSRAEASEIAVRVREDVFERQGVAVYSTYVPEPGSHFLGDIFRAVSLLLLALGVLSLVLSALLVVNTVSAIMAQQIRQVGVMKAIGARSEQITQMYLGMVAAYGVLAVVVGLPVSAVAGRWFTQFAAEILNFTVVSYVPPVWVTVLAVGVGLLVPLAAAYVPVRAGTRTSVVHALNATGMSTFRFGHRTFDRILGRIRGLPRPVALSLRNTFLRTGRLSITLATLALASAVVMSVFSVRSSVEQTIDDLEAWWRYDAQVILATGADVRGIEREVVRVSGVSEVESWIDERATLVRDDGTENESLAIIGLPPTTTFVAPVLVEGRWLEPGDTDAVVVNTEAANDEATLALGSTVTLRVQGEERAWKVVGIIKGQLRGPVVFANRSAVARVMGAASVSRVLMRTEAHDAAFQRTVLLAAEDALEARGYRVGNSRTQNDLREEIAGQLGILIAFLVVMAALLAIVGVIGLTGSMTLNVLESTREIGVMRAVGARHRSIYGIFIAEGLVSGFISWFIGAAAAYPMSIGLTRLVEVAIGVPLSYRFSWEGVGLWLTAIVVISAMASLAPAFRASQVSVRDAISYE